MPGQNERPSLVIVLEIVVQRRVYVRPLFPELKRNNLSRLQSYKCRKIALTIIRHIQIRQILENLRALHVIILHTRTQKRIVNRHDRRSVRRRVGIYGRIDKDGINVLICMLRKVCPVVHI